MRGCILATAFVAAVAGSAQHPRSAARTSACFLLTEIGVGEIRRQPAEACTTRLPPASTFKIPHALAALDGGVLAGADTVLLYDGSPQPNDTWRRDHTLASAMRYSVVWYFQRVAERLGIDRERAYLRKLSYGNADPSSGLTTFWLGGSLLISPEEERRFLMRLYSGDLPVSPAAIDTVRRILVQPTDRIVNATGEHAFAQPWPPSTVLSAKTGSVSFDGGRAVRWLVGHVSRNTRAWVFVSCVTGDAAIDAMAAVDLAARALRENGVL